MEQKELKKILDDHKLWLDSNGEKGTRANLSYANLSCANLEGANLSDADLRGAYLRNADLENANLEGANLSDADLRGAYLENADLTDANLTGAHLENARLKHTLLPTSLDNIPEGELVGYKKVQNCIVKLQILAGSKRSRATSDKCRCDKALVLAIENIDGTDSGLKQITNLNFTPTTYEVGEIVRADSWDEDRWYECSHGIHFFLDREMAVVW